MVDLGCGDGALLRHLARARPDCTFVGLEQAPLLWGWAWLAARGIPNLIIVRGDFWRHSLQDYALVYAFLSPAAMARLWQKACAEMSLGAVLVSHRFPVSDTVSKTRIAECAARHAGLHCYLPAGMDGSSSSGVDNDRIRP
jgi:trans-aconitate methyltransferase